MRRRKSFRKMYVVYTVENRVANGKIKTLG